MNFCQAWRMDQRGRTAFIRHGTGFGAYTRRSPPGIPLFFGILALASTLLLVRHEEGNTGPYEAIVRPPTDRADAAISAAGRPAALAAKLAEADKFIANREMSAQNARGGRYDATDTIGFADLQAEFPWLKNLRRTVAFLRSGNRFGSAILLDMAGTVVLCAHEMPIGQRDSLRLSFNIAANGKTIAIKSDHFVYDRPHDLMFASIDPALVAKYHLLPVSWGRLSLQSAAIAAGGDIISVGWPMPSFRLHATRGVVTGTSLTENYRDNAGEVAMLACKIRSSAATFGGMSGGGVFRNQRLVGVINGGTSPGTDASTDFTPVDLIREAYISLFPARSRQAGISRIDGADTPLECRFNLDRVTHDPAMGRKVSRR